MARLGIYPECEAGNHGRLLVEQLLTDRRWTLRTVGVAGCGRMACTCPCHHMTIQWYAGEVGLAGGSYSNSLHQQYGAVTREIYGYLEPQEVA